MERTNALWCAHVQLRPVQTDLRRMRFDFGHLQIHLRHCVQVDCGPLQPHSQIRSLKGAKFIRSLNDLRC